MALKTTVKTHCDECGKVQATIRKDRISENRCTCKHVPGTPVDPPRSYPLKKVLVLFNGPTSGAAFDTDYLLEELSLRADIYEAVRDGKINPDVLGTVGPKDKGDTRGRGPAE